MSDWVRRFHYKSGLAAPPFSIYYLANGFNPGHLVQALFHYQSHLHRCIQQGYNLTLNFLVDFWSCCDAKGYLSIIRNGYVRC